MFSIKAAKIILLIGVLGFIHPVFAKTPKKAVIDSYTRIKKQVIDLVLMNQRAQSITLIDTELKHADEETKNKLLTLKYNTLNEFLTLASQDAFETAAATVLSEKKKLLKSIQECLSLEPDNLRCQWLELKYLKRYDESQFSESALKYIDVIQDFKPMSLVKASLRNMLKLDEGVFFKIPVLAKNFTLEDDVLTHVLEFKVLIKNKEFEKAKFPIKHLILIANDYPDIIFMKYQLASLARTPTDEEEKNLDKQYDVYKKKCADLPASIVRKYIFDIELCTRSLN